MDTTTLPADPALALGATVTKTRGNCDRGFTGRLIEIRGTRQTRYGALTTVMVLGGTSGNQVLITTHDLLDLTPDAELAAPAGDMTDAEVIAHHNRMVANLS